MLKDLNDASDRTSSWPVMSKFGQKELLSREHWLSACLFSYLLVEVILNTCMLSNLVPFSIYKLDTICKVMGFNFVPGAIDSIISFMYLGSYTKPKFARVFLCRFFLVVKKLFHQPTTIYDMVIGAQLLFHQYDLHENRPRTVFICLFYCLLHLLNL